MRTFFFILLSTLLCVGCTPVTSMAPATVAGTAATVTRVVDGDTVEATDDKGTRLKLRILGIDTPETHHPHKPVECYGPEATEFARATLLNQPVVLQQDPSQDVRDRYDRLLMYVVLADGRDYSVLAAGAGMARSYVYDKHPVSKYRDILAAERDAQNAKRGLWGACMF